jgi:hypothetical protein
VRHLTAQPRCDALQRGQQCLLVVRAASGVV